MLLKYSRSTCSMGDCVCVYGIFFSAISLNGLAVSISLLANSFRICFFLNFPFTRFHLDVDDVLTWLVCSCHLLYTLFFFSFPSTTFSSSPFLFRSFHFLNLSFAPIPYPHTFCVTFLLVYSIFVFMCVCVWML